jgi:Fic family protein
MISEESVARIEPCILDEMGAEIVDLVAGLSSAAAVLGARLHPRSAAGLADAVRIMNCYYSNLLEGHNTTPREIEAALRGQFEATGDRRNFQIEARAHVRLQREIDRRHADGDLNRPRPISSAGCTGSSTRTLRKPCLPFGAKRASSA